MGNQTSTKNVFEIRYARPIEETIVENGPTILYNCYYCNNMTEAPAGTKVFKMPGKTGVYGYHCCEREECIEKYNRSVLKEISY